MAALDYPLEIEQGADYGPLAFPISGVGSLAGWSVAGQVRMDHPSRGLLHTLDVTCSGTDVVLHVPAAASAAWGWRSGRYDVELTSPTGKVTRVLKGAVRVDPEVTTT